MNLKPKTGLLPLCLLCLAYLPFFALAPSLPVFNVIRIILGLPVLLFTPGYTLAAALFPRQQDMDTMERLGLSFGLSVILIAAAGIILNCTGWGVRPMPVVYTLTGGSILFCLAAFLRRASIPEESRFQISQDNKGLEHRGGWLKVLQVIAVLCALGAFIYIIVIPKQAEPFTEFYIQEADGTGGLPAGFIISRSEVSAVIYGDNEPVNTSTGLVSLAIVNNESGDISYIIRATIDGSPLDIYYGGIREESIGPVTLSPGEKWQQDIGLAPSSPGDNQKIELFLFKNGSPTPDYTLHFWVDVVGE